MIPNIAWRNCQEDLLYTLRKKSVFPCRKRFEAFKARITPERELVKVDQLVQVSHCGRCTRRESRGNAGKWFSSCKLFSIKGQSKNYPLLRAGSRAIGEEYFCPKSSSHRGSYVRAIWEPHPWINRKVKHFVVGLFWKPYWKVRGLYDVIARSIGIHPSGIWWKFLLQGSGKTTRTA